VRVNNLSYTRLHDIFNVQITRNTKIRTFLVIMTTDILFFNEIVTKKNELVML